MKTASVSSASTGRTSSVQERAASPASSHLPRQGWLNEERIEVLALSSGDNVEIPCASGGIPSLTTLPRRSEISIAPASYHEIDEIPHAASESDLTVDSEQQDLLTRQSAMHGNFFKGSTSKLRSLLAKTDSAAAVAQFQNKQYLAQERLTANLPRFGESVANLHIIFQHPDIPQKERNELTRMTLDLMHKIDRVAKEQPASRKLATKLLMSMASIGLCMLPLLTAKKNKDYQYLSLLIAAYAKTMLMLAGLAHSRTADAGSYRTHIKERHFPTLTPALPYALAAFNTPTKQFADRNPLAFNGAAAAFTGMTFLLCSAPHLITGPINALYNTVKGHFDRNPDADTDTSPATLTEQIKDEVGILADAFRTQHEAMSQRRNAFEESGNQLSDVLSTQVSDIDYAAMNLDDALKKLFGSGTEGAIAGTVTRANDDLPKKLGFTILAAVFCAASAATYYDEPMGLIDLGMDAGLTIGEMAATMLNPAETAQRAAEKFANYSGLSLLLLPFGIVNKIPATHFTDSLAGLVVGTILLTCGNMTLPRPSAEFLSQAVMKLIDRVKASRQVQMENNAEPGTEMARHSSVRLSGAALPAPISGNRSLTAAHETGQSEQIEPQSGTDRLDVVIVQSEMEAASDTRPEKQ